MNQLKSILLSYCENYLNEKQQVLQTELELAQESTNDQSKSSAGDKHETGRAMAQLQQEKLSAQFLEIDKQKQILTKINPEVINSNIGVGSIVETNIGIFFIAIAIGKITIDNTSYFIVSTSSPVGQALIQNKDSKAEFNGTVVTIVEVY